MIERSTPRGAGFDLLRVPMLQRLLRWKHARTVLQLPLFIISLLMIAHGFLGTDISPMNLATTLSWVHFRGALVLVVLLAGNFFCLACPFMLPRQLARRWFPARHNWPRRLRNKWVSIALFVAVLFAYELFDLWASPWWTASLIAAYFVAAVVIDGIFKHATFCKFVCPIGQFNFVASAVSPLEVAVRDHQICAACSTRDCIRGRREPLTQIVIQRGCELALFQPLKKGNMDCTFCLDCVQACPHDNVGILARTPGEELVDDRSRSGIGFFSKRRDLAALVIVFCFGALLNVFGMVSPVYAIEQAIAEMMGAQREAPVLAILFGLFLIVEPVLLLAVAAWLTRSLTKSKGSLLTTAVRYTYGLVPLGFSVWLSHYCFHFLIGLLTFVPVFQSAAAAAGFPFLGEPRWGLGGLPANRVYPVQLGFLVLGLIGSLAVLFRIAEEDCGEQRVKAFSPWAALCVIFWVAAIWLMSQPMQTRGAFFAN